MSTRLATGAGLSLLVVVGALIGLPAGTAAAQLPSGLPAGVVNAHSATGLPPLAQSLSKTVQVLDVHGNPVPPVYSCGNGLPTAFPGDILRYTIAYSLVGSYDVGSLVLTDDIGPVVDGYGSLVPGSIATSTNLPMANVRLTGTPAELDITVPIASNVLFPGVADGTFTVTYQVKLGPSFPSGANAGTTLGGSNSGPCSDPAGNGVKAETNTVNANGVSIAGSALGDKDQSGSAGVNLLNPPGSPGGPTIPATPNPSSPGSPQPSTPSGPKPSNPGPGQKLVFTGAAITGIAVVGLVLFVAGLPMIALRRRHTSED